MFTKFRGKIFFKKFTILFSPPSPLFRLNFLFDVFPDVLAAVLEPDGLVGPAELVYSVDGLPEGVPPFTVADPQLTRRGYLLPGVNSHLKIWWLSGRAMA